MELQNRVCKCQELSINTKGMKECDMVEITKKWEIQDQNSRSALTSLSLVGMSSLCVK